MISRTLLAVAGVACRPRLPGVIGTLQAGQRRALTASQSMRSANSKGNDDKHLWIEDNIFLEIKDAENETIVETKLVSTGREDKLIKTSDTHSTACALCRLNLKNLDYTDVMILGQFIKKNGSIVTYHESKLCSNQYRKVVKLIGQARRCNLIQRPADYFVPGPWHDLNTYLEPDRKRDQSMKVIKKEYWRI